ncbi:hypothetical protein [Salinibacillus xinjiangensis]|uniref:Uncharacterized protein n=1 Tax=Salinibacillus xinjiangensis TaxID=1229268 RepID=A0A6G1XAF1_9BACI|nr:hypothetical protein [Salinibacillus xinjiangensis]MRG87917.1 hypothetical protein [Salinibacillus xinjiangensis]
MKKLGVTIIVVCASLFFSISAFAQVVGGSWSYPAGSYAPNTGSYYTNSQEGSSYNDLVYFRMHSIDYTYSEVSSIRDYYYDHNYYHGYDATDLNDNLDTSESSMATNLPNYKFDTDDDDANSIDEEAEVVSLSPTSISSTTDYYYSVDFVNRGGGSDSIYNAPGDGTIEINAHESSKAWNGEYNTQYYSRLGTVNYYAQ